MLSLNSLLKALIVAAVVSKVHCDVLKGTDDVDSSNSSLVGESGVLIKRKYNSCSIAACFIMGGDSGLWSQCDTAFRWQRHSS